MIGHSLVKHRNTTMAAADFCTITPRVTTRRAVTTMILETAVGRARAGRDGVRQRQANRPGLEVRGTFSPARAGVLPSSPA